MTATHETTADGTVLTDMVVGVGRLMRSMVRHPVLTLTAALEVSALWSGRWAASVAALVLTGVVLGLWATTSPGSFERWVTFRVRACWRRFWWYGRHWQPVMTVCGLTVTHSDRTWLPGLRRVVCDRWRDLVLVRLARGQSPTDFENRAGELAHSFAAASCRVRVARPGWVWLEFARADPLAAITPALPVPATTAGVDLLRIPVGVAEDGTPWVLPVLGAHLLVAGASSAGKGSVVWSLIRGLTPAIRDGSVHLWVVDPKGGMELGAGESLFTRFATTAADAADLLDDAVTGMQARAARLRGVTRLHTPTPTDPLVLVVVDEIAALTAYVTDRDLKKRLAAALPLLLSQGRAVGYSVIGALQDPGKDVLPFRDLFAVRVGLRLIEPEQTRMVLGDGARTRGAVCDRIPLSTPGVGYVLRDGDPDPVRVRAAWVTDDDITAMAADYAPTPATAPGLRAVA